VLPTEVEDEFRVEDEFPAPLNVFSRSATACTYIGHKKVDLENNQVLYVSVGIKLCLFVLM